MPSTERAPGVDFCGYCGGTKPGHCLRPGAEGCFFPLARPAISALTPVAIDQSGIEVYTSDGIYLKQWSFPHAGVMVPQHAHCWDHLTMVARGAVHVWRDGEYAGRFAAPAGIEIKAGVKHTFQVLEANTVLYCLHNLHDADKVAILAEHELEFG